MIFIDIFLGMCGRNKTTIPIGIKTIQEWISRTPLHELSEELNNNIGQTTRPRLLNRNNQQVNVELNILPPLLALTVNEDNIITIPPDSPPISPSVAIENHL